VLAFSGRLNWPKEPYATTNLVFLATVARRVMTLMLAEEY
jgi:hypothetical protein